MPKFLEFQRSLVFLASLLVSGSALSTHAQAPIVEEPNFEPSLTFDVSTIRPSPPRDGKFHVAVSSPPHSSRFEASNLTVKALLQIAYGFDTPIADGPDWITNTFYDVKARSDEEADARLSKLSDNEARLEKRNAIRALLAERLGLKTHLENRNSSIYNLIVVKGGPKLQPVPQAPPGETPAAPLAADARAHPSRHGLEFVGTNASIRAIAGILSAMIEAPVIDKTALTGTYNYTLQFGREWSTQDPEGWPSIFTAVQEQLGLKLEAVHESVTNLVIDHITKPSEN